MTIQIRIDQQVLGGNLFNDDGYDVVASSRNYAAACETAFIAALTTKYPGANIEVRQDIEPHICGASRITNALIWDDAIPGELLADDLRDELADVERSVYETFAWAVEASA